MKERSGIKIGLTPKERRFFMIKAVIFDMDGTIFDTEVVYRKSWVTAAKEMGLEIDILSELPNITGRNHANTAQYFAEQYGTDFPFAQLFATMWKHSDRVLETNVPPRPYIPEVLESLRADGYLLAIASSTNRERVNRYLTVSGFAHYFDAVISGERVKNGKPAPDIFLLAAETLGVSPEECVVVEDSRQGVLAGINAGMPTVMIPEFQPCTEDLKKGLWLCLDSAKELPERIAEYNASF